MRKPLAERVADVQVGCGRCGRPLMWLLRHDQDYYSSVWATLENGGGVLRCHRRCGAVYRVQIDRLVNATRDARRAGIQRLWVTAAGQYTTAAPPPARPRRAG